MAVKDDKIAIVPKDNYIKLLDETCVIIKKLHTEVLNHYHKLGEKVAELTSRPDKYGNHTVQMFSDDLNTKGIQLGADSLYNAQQIFKHISTKQLKMAKEAGLPLRKALLLCRKTVDDDTRQAVIEEAFEAKDQDGKFDVQEAIAAKNQATPPVAPDIDKEVKRAAKILKSAEKMINDLENKLKEVGLGVEQICVGDCPERIKSAYSSFDDANLAVDSLTEIWAIQVARANKAFESVKEIIEE